MWMCTRAEKCKTNTSTHKHIHGICQNFHEFRLCGFGLSLFALKLCSLALTLI